MDLRRGLIVGGCSTLLAGGLTTLYLSMITIDDGLEALIFIPILGTLLGIAGAAGGAKGRSVRWIGGITLGIGIVLVVAESLWLVWILTHQHRTSETPSMLASPLELFSMAALAGLSTIGTLAGGGLIISTAGWFAGSFWHRRRLERLPHPPQV